jgi:hypothetical protein
VARVLLFYLFLFPSCSNSKKPGSPSEPKKIKFHFLPVQISYSGVGLEDSLKDFITQYFQSKNIEVLDKEYANVLMSNEIKKAGSSITSKEPEKRWKQIQRMNDRYLIS